MLFFQTRRSLLWLLVTICRSRKKKSVGTKWQDRESGARHSLLDYIGPESYENTNFETF